MRLTLHLSKGISRVLKELLKYFNSAVILASFVLPAAKVFLLFLPWI